MSSILGFDPIELITQCVILVLVIVVALITWRYRDRVLLAVTGDDRIHGTSLDCVWFCCFRCCGLCSGDWTRCFTRCPCCPRRVRGANLVQVIGQLCGFTTYTVELKNIVVGDLPWDRRADFYLSVECASNPPMMTSLAEEKLPKVVHFPEILTLRLRWSLMESPVRIAVLELNVLGSTELCSCHIPAMSILDWSVEENERMKRFEMKPKEQHNERETPAWILVEFDRPSEPRDLEHFKGKFSIVRTATRDGHYEDKPVSDFKAKYTLLDNTGHAIQEPLEEDLHEIACLRCVVSSAYHFCNCLVFIVVAAYVCFRTYVGSCYHQMKWLTMAKMMLPPASFPISPYNLKILVQKCHQQVDGTGAANGIACRPNRTQVLEVCTNTSSIWHENYNQPRPSAGGVFVDRWFGRLGVGSSGITCFYGACGMRNNIVEYDRATVVIGIVLVLGTLFCRACSNQMIRSRRTRLQRQRAIETKEAQAHMRTKSRRSGLLGR